jgi:hypothetical protein
VGGEYEQWDKAVKLLDSKTSRDGPDTALSRGLLLVILCAAGDWTAAMDQLDLFLAAAPTTFIKGVLDYLGGLARTLPVETDKLARVQHQLENALDASQTASDGWA